MLFWYDLNARSTMNNEYGVTSTFLLIIKYWEKFPSLFLGFLLQHSLSKSKMPIRRFFIFEMPSLIFFNFSYDIQYLLGVMGKKMEMANFR